MTIRTGSMRHSLKSSRTAFLVSSRVRSSRHSKRASRSKSELEGVLCALFIVRGAERGESTLSILRLDVRVKRSDSDRKKIAYRERGTRS